MATLSQLIAHSDHQLLLRHRINLSLSYHRSGGIHARANVRYRRNRPAMMPPSLLAPVSGVALLALLCKICVMESGKMRYSSTAVRFPTICCELASNEKITFMTTNN